jgi:hypothetical protein
MIEEGLHRVGQVCIAVRDTHGIDAKNPLPFFAVKQRIEAALSAYAGRSVVVLVPNLPTSSTGEMSAIPSSGLFSTRRQKRFPPLTCAGSAPRVNPQ